MTGHVLVTGGAGFIGSHLVDAYVARGWRVSVIDDLSTGQRENVNEAASLMVLDLRDPRAAEAVRDLRPDVISHHAAQMDVRRSVSDPVFDAETNIVATLRLLQAAAGAGVRKVIFASTGGAIYGEPVEVPQTESHPTLPLSPYGCAKLSVEHYLHYFSVACGLPYAALRYANVYGPRQNAKGEAGVIAIFSRALLAGQTPTINGSGEQTRDYVYVDDLVRANLAATEGDLTGAFNVGTGIETSVNGLFEALARAAGAKGEALHGPAKPGEQMRSVLDGTYLRTRAALPAPLMLDEGLRRTVEWFRARIRA
jgi:UDP-glucose 4-epimerase